MRLSVLISLVTLAPTAAISGDVLRMQTGLRSASAGAALGEHNPLSVRGGDVKAAPELYANAVAVGEKKAAAPASKVAVLGFLSGCHVGFGALLGLLVGGNMPSIGTANPGLQKLLFGLFGLPFGLYMVLVAGGELFTGNTALVAAALIERRATWSGLLRNWSTSYLGNLVGSLAIARLFTAAGILGDANIAASIALAKVSKPFATVFLRGIICNWLVCMAVWVSLGTSSLVGKYLAMVLPVSAFVAFGGEHSIANMFLLPFGKMMGGSLTWGDIITKNLLPVTLGNIVGGVVCQTGLYSLAYGSLGSRIRGFGTRAKTARVSERDTRT